jgi:hypothetical protein
VHVTLRVGPLLVGFYAWIVAVSCGAILLDVVYARLAADVVTDVRDLLLGIVAVTIVAGVGAVAAAWTFAAPRYLLLASVVLVVVEPLVPALLSGVVRDAEGALGVAIGPWIRIGGSGLASVLAFFGLWAFGRATAGDA